MAEKVTTTIFTSNETQMVCLPKSVEFPAEVAEVEVVVIGNIRLICPIGHRWDTFFGRETKISDDVLAERDQGIADEREPL